MLLREIKKYININKEEAFKQRERDKRRQEALKATDEPHDNSQPAPDEPVAPQLANVPPVPVEMQSPAYREERIVARLFAKFGMCYLCDTTYEDGVSPTTVVEYIYNELSMDNTIGFTDPTFAQVFEIALQELEPFYQDLARVEQEAALSVKDVCEKEIRAIDPVGKTVDNIESEERRIRSKYSLKALEHVNEFRQLYLERHLCSHPDDRVREMSSRLVTERHQLSKIHTQYAQVLTEFDRLNTLVPEALDSWRLAIIQSKIDNIPQLLKQAASYEEITTLLQEQQKLQLRQKELAKLVGERVLTP